MKKVAIAALMLAMALCMFGCANSSGSHQEQNSESLTLEKPQITHSYDLSKNISYQGVTIQADPSWEIKSPEECNFYVHVDDRNDHIGIQTVLHGQTAELDTAWKEFFNSNDSPSVINEWNDSGINYISGIVEKSKTNYWLLAGCEKSSGKGFLLSFTLSKEVWPETDQEHLFNDVTGTLTFDPLETSLDFHDWWNANIKKDKDISNAESINQPETEQAIPTPTVSQQNALKKANSYLSHTAFSYTGLIEQLEYSKFSTEDATYAADNCGADWNIQAEKKAASYLSHAAFSYDGLVEQLEYSGFTHEQAIHGADSTGL